MKDTFDAAGSGRIFIAAQAGLFLLLGYGVLLAPDPFLALVTDEPGNVEVRTGLLRIVGAALGCLALSLLCLLPMPAPEVGRRITAGLYVGNGFLFLAVAFELILNDKWGRWAFVVFLFLSVVVSIILSKTGLAPRWNTLEHEPVDLQQRWKEQIEEAAAQQERNRLARDLHDSIKQQLFSIRVGSATIEARWDNDPAGAREALRHVRQSAHEATVEMQALLLQLRPAALANAGLVEALREQAEALGYRTGAKVEVEIGHLPSNERIPAAAQEALFRIAQEALSNIARHARASTVHIRLGSRKLGSGESLVLEVRDDGQGFDPAAPEAGRGMGLRNLRDRIQPFQGSMEITSAPGQGTAVEVSLPLASLGPKAAATGSRKFRLYIQSSLILCPLYSFGVLFSLLQFGDPQFPLIAFLLAHGVALSLYSLADENKPWITRTALERIYCYCALVWANPLFLMPVEALEEQPLGTTLPLAFGLFGIGMILLETGRYAYRRWRHPEPLPKMRRQALPILLLGFAATVGLAFLVDDPGVVSRWALGISGASAVLWWLRQKLGREEA